jgi:hypothetical protein
MLVGDEMWQHWFLTRREGCVFTESVCCLQQSADELVDAVLEPEKVVLACRTSNKSTLYIYISIDSKAGLAETGQCDHRYSREDECGNSWLKVSRSQEKIGLAQQLTSVLLCLNRLIMCWDCN